MLAHFPVSDFTQCSVGVWIMNCFFACVVFGELDKPKYCIELLSHTAWWELGRARWLATPIACRASSWRWAPPPCVRSKLWRGHCGKQISEIFHIIRFYNWENQTQHNACTVFVLDVLSTNFGWSFLPFMPATKVYFNMLESSLVPVSSSLAKMLKMSTMVQGLGLQNDPECPAHQDHLH